MSPNQTDPLKSAIQQTSKKTTSGAESGKPEKSSAQDITEQSLKTDENVMSFMQCPDPAIVKSMGFLADDQCSERGVIPKLNRQDAMTGLKEMANSDLSQ